MVIESKPGAGGALAWSTLNTYPGDGYTVMGTNLPHIVLQPLEGNVQYRTDDVTNVHFYQYTPDAIIVRNESPFKTYQDLVKAAKEGQDKVTFAGLGPQLGQPRGAHAPEPACWARRRRTFPFKGNRRPRRVGPRRHVSAAMSYNTLAILPEEQGRMLAVASEKRPGGVPGRPDLQGARAGTGSMAPTAAWASRSRRRRTCASASRTSSPRSTRMRSFARRWPRAARTGGHHLRQDGGPSWRSGPRPTSRWRS